MAKGRRVSVRPSTKSNFNYGFTTQVTAAESTELRHVLLTNQTAPAIFGVNSPKPARMKKIRSSGQTTTSFVDASARITAQNAGWSLVKLAKARGASTGRFSRTVFVTMQVGNARIKYAWNMKLSLYTAIGNVRSQLGIQNVTNQTPRFELVFGANTKPPKAYRKNTDGSILSTFCDPDVTLPAGWARESSGEQE